MLELKDIVKTYPVADSTVTALNGVTLTFRSNEFVAVLGQSGCGKTTLLNIVGGLDQYTSGDLVIDGRSTKGYSDADWDAYRNHTVGFVFQSYNLIPHQTVLANVELALTLDGVSRAERTRRATEALERVGLGDQLSKKPAMMSGGQMQRVAIARAIVNNPSVILADEPTGALDSKTSVQIMDLLKEIAADRLVVMVTHNPELAEEYATRIVRLSDGSVVSDSNPPSAAELAAEPVEAKPAHTHLPFSAALGLSANNLRTKKGRAFLTAFAGAIGIIGIALILSLSSGMNDYIHRLETDVMGSYPIQIDRTTLDMASVENEGASGDGSGGGDAGSMLADEAKAQKDAEEPDPGKLTSHNVVGDVFRRLDSVVAQNHLGVFRDYIESHRDAIDPYVTAVTYSYDVSPQVWRPGADGSAVLVSPRSLLEDQGGYASMTMSQASGISTGWKQLVDDQTLREDHYELLAGDWPQAADEVALVVDEDYQISDFDLYTLGLMDIDRMQDVIDAAEADEAVDDPAQSFDYDQAIGREYTVFSPSQLYEKSGDVYQDRSGDEEYMAGALDDGRGEKVHVTAVLRAKEQASYTSGVVYTGELTHSLMAVAADTPVVKAQLADPDTNVLTGTAFADEQTEALQSLDSVYGSMMGGMMSFSADRGAVGPARAGLATAGSARLVAGRQPLDRLGRPIPVDAVTGDGAGAGGSGGDAGAGADGGDTGSGDPAATVTVTFVNWDGATLSGPTDYAPGAAVTAPAAPTRAGDGTNNYVFIGWQPDGESSLYPTGDTIPAAAKTVTYRAVFAAIPATETDESTAAIIAALAKLTPEQRELVARAVSGGQVSVDDLIKAGIITQDQLDAARDEAAKQLQGEMEKRADEYVQKYIDSIDTDALFQRYLQNYLAGMDPDELMRQYLAKQMGGASMEDLVRQYLSSMDRDQLMELFGAGIEAPDLEELMAQMQGGQANTYDAVMAQLGYATEDDPYAVTFYPVDFNGKQEVQAFIDGYNAQASEGDRITYTDMVGLMTRSITEIIDIITAVLVAFVSISLVVSSIMIAIITYISVLERTKEIGILRALGASKGDITRIFNAETFIEGLLSGLIGVVVTVLLDIPISAFIYEHYAADNIAYLPPVYALLLIGISVALTFIAGFIPARLAAKKDPVEALRSE